MLCEQHAELGAVIEAAIRATGTCDDVFDLGKCSHEMTELVAETLRLHPEEFTQLPNGNWIDNVRAIKH